VPHYSNKKVKDVELVDKKSGKKGWRRKRDGRNTYFESILTIASHLEN
jgi:hypothetical protein